MTREEFTQRIKQKNPQWQNIEDDVLIEQVLKRYPVYQKQIDGIPTQPTQTQPIIEEPKKVGRFRETFEDVKQTFGNIKSRFTGGAEKLEETREAYQSGEQGMLSSLWQTLGTAAGVGTEAIGDLFTGAVKGVLSQEQEDALKSGVQNVAQSVLENPTVEQTVKNSIEYYQGLDPETQRNLESLFNVSMFAADVAGFGVAKKGIQTGVKTTKRVFDKSLDVADRITNVRKAVGVTGKETVEEVAEETTEQVAKKSFNFFENPNITGALDDIKIMVGLPDSAPAVDLTFRAVKPRIKKGAIRRVKEQMALANQTIVENGFKPTNIRDYADAIFQTKKKVWDKIQSKLDAGQTAGMEVDLIPIAVKILNRADDTALLRTNPQASKQLVNIAEDLVAQGGSVDILTAERIKQFLNAELDNAFGVTDLSQQAKEAKKLITKEIGTQLDDVLSTLPDEFRNLKIEYGSLSSIEEDVLKRLIVFERQNPEGLADILTKTEAAADIAFGGVQGRLKGIARLTMGQQLKKANNADELVKRAFQKLKKIDSPKVKAPASAKTASLADEARKYKTAEEFVEAQDKGDVLQKLKDATKITIDNSIYKEVRLSEEMIPKKMVLKPAGKVGDYLQSSKVRNAVKDSLDTPVYIYKGIATLNDVPEASYKGIFSKEAFYDDNYNLVDAILINENQVSKLKDVSVIFHEAVHAQRVKLGKGFDFSIPYEKRTFEQSAKKAEQFFKDNELTKSQLTEIWKKANKTTPEASLITEAKKYKTAEEFIEAQDRNNNLIHIYRGQKSGDKLVIEGVSDGVGRPFTKNKDIANVYGRKGNVLDGFIDKNDVLQYDKLDENTKKYAKSIVDERLDNVMTEWQEYDNFQPYEDLVFELSEIARIKNKKAIDVESFNIPSEKEVRVLSSDAFLTKSQLTDIWNKAKK